MRFADNDLYMRGAATLLASWEEYARGSAGAALKRLNGERQGPSRGSRFKGRLDILRNAAVSLETHRG